MPTPYVIVAGAGAGEGGVSVMRRVLSALPEDFAASIVLLMHSAVDDDDPMPHLVQGTGRIYVSLAVDGAPVSPGHVHVVPRGCRARIRAPGVLEITKPGPARTSRPAINDLFESAAAVYGSRCVGLILTGKGDDGTDGSRAIGAAGGITMVQSVVDSKDPEMPASALVGDHPNQCQLIQQIAPALMATTNRTSR